jgi:FMN phosphatase YigB (HAD superfamily)
MIRAVLFDFYGVWLPDSFAEFLEQARQHDYQAGAELETQLYQYFHGQLSVEDLVGSFRFKLNRMDLDPAQFVLNEGSIAPAIVDFMRELHGHFVKLGVLANLGSQELQLLNNFNQHNQLFEIIASPLAFGSEQRLLTNEIFAQTLQAIGEPPQNCLVVTGNPDYQNFAQNLGMTVLPFEGFPKLRQDLEQRLASETA